MIRVALVGLGKMGISHQALISAHPEANLVAVCDQAEMMLDVIGKNLKVKTYTSLESLLNAESLDAIFVATPSRFHADMVRTILNKGISVFCEKPLCLDPVDSAELAEIADAKGLVNQVGYHYRFVATFQEMKRLLDADVIGELHHVRAEAYGPVVLRPKGGTWRTAKAEGGGCLYDYACHAIDLVNFLVGTPVAASGGVLNRIFSRDVEDEVYATLHFRDGLSGQLAVNWSDEAHRKMTTQVTVYGKKGKIVADRQEVRVYLRTDEDAPPGFEAGWNTRNITELAEEVWFYLRGEEYSAQVAHFIEAVASGAATATRSTFRSGADADAVAAAVASSAQAAGARVDVATAERVAPASTRKRNAWSLLAGKRA